MLPCCLSTAIVPPGHVIVLMGCNGSSVRPDSERSLRGRGRDPTFWRRVNHHHSFIHMLRAKTLVVALPVCEGSAFALGSGTMSGLLSSIKGLLGAGTQGRQQGDRAQRPAKNSLPAAVAGFLGTWVGGYLDDDASDGRYPNALRASRKRSRQEDSDGGRDVPRLHTAAGARRLQANGVDISSTPIEPRLDDGSSPRQPKRRATASNGVGCSPSVDIELRRRRDASAFQRRFQRTVDQQRRASFVGNDESLHASRLLHELPALGVTESDLRADPSVERLVLSPEGRMVPAAAFVDRSMEAATEVDEVRAQSQRRCPCRACVRLCLSHPQRGLGHQGEELAAQQQAVHELRAVQVANAEAAQLGHELGACTRWRTVEAVPSAVNVVCVSHALCACVQLTHRRMRCRRWQPRAEVRGRLCVRAVVLLSSDTGLAARGLCEHTVGFGWNGIVADATQPWGLQLRE